MNATKSHKFDSCILCDHARVCHIRWHDGSVQYESCCIVPMCKCVNGAFDFTDYFWNVYIPAHSKPITKLMHLAGVTATFAYFILCLMYLPLFMLLLTPFIVYPFAWSSHFFFEKNKPLAFKNPLYAKASDFVMCFGILTGFLKLKQVSRE